MQEQILPAEGKLGILLPGLGAVASTMIAGVIATRKGLSKPIGSLTQTGHIELEEGSRDSYALIKDYVPLAALEDVVFGGWDIYEDNIYQAATHARVLDQRLLDSIRPELEVIKPMKAVFDRDYVRNLDGKFIKQSATKWDAAQELIKDIETFKKANNVSRVVIVWTGSTEKYLEQSAVHETIATFEAGLKNNDVNIAPSMVYAYAAVSQGIPFINGAPNLTTDIPAIVQLARKTKTPIGGKDFKTGQTLMKTIVAPGLAARSLGVTGWYSTNILGNRDGLVLDDEENFKTKEVSKLGVLEDILRPDLHPDLYGDLYHKIRINYYPPHGDNKESWDNIDIFGWLNYPMQIKINFLCRDSILAAPIVLDLALFADLAQRSGMYGVQEWLSFYLKSPQTQNGEQAENDVFKQLNTLKQVLRTIKQQDTQELPALDLTKETEPAI
jgi:myo-inositol-1-phosphate synthase